MSSFGFGGSAPLSLIPVEPPAVEAVVAEEKPVKAASKRRRAHEADGTFKADDPATPEVNEAWQEGR